MDELPTYDALRGVTALDGSTKARIERAALQLFATRNIDAVTTREIAADAGLSEGALYRHFASKEEIAKTLFFAIHTRLADLAQAAALTSPDIEDQAASFVRAYAQTADDDWMLFAFHLLSMHRFLPGDDPYAPNPVAVVEQMVAAAMKKGDIAKGDPVLVAGMALGVVLQPALHRAYGRLISPLLDNVPALTKAVIAVLNPTKSAKAR